MVDTFTPNGSLCNLSFFFLVLRRPPRSTLFPSRRSSDLPVQDEATAGEGRTVRHGGVVREQHVVDGDRRRSEEHTSELQSPDHLVCRLLLEKKKTEPEQANTLTLQAPTNNGPHPAQPPDD